MKRILFTLLLTHSLTAAALDTQIKITQEQIDNLDVKVGPLTASSEVPLLYAPAKVIMPANRERLISSTVSGLVMQLQANIGDSIEKGQLLAQINSPELVALQREFLTASSERNLSALGYQRDKKLLEEGVIADRRWQETQTLHSGKLAQFDTARQLLAMAGMSPAEISTLAHTRKLSNLLNIRAPISGVVLERTATVGARLDMQAPLYRIADLSELWIEINIPQERLNAIHIGDQVRIENTAITAKISLLGQSVNRDNQTVMARAVIEGKPAGLRVGQSVNIQIMQHSAQSGFKVPNTAIALNEGHAYVFVRNQEGFAVTEVQVTGKQDAESLIGAGLSGNQQIAIKGAVALKANWLGLGGGE